MNTSFFFLIAQTKERCTQKNKKQANKTLLRNKRKARKKEKRQRSRKKNKGKKKKQNKKREIKWK